MNFDQLLRDAGADLDRLSAERTSNTDLAFVSPSAHPSRTALRVSLAIGLAAVAATTMVMIQRNGPEAEPQAPSVGAQPATIPSSPDESTVTVVSNAPAETATPQTTIASTAANSIAVQSAPTTSGPLLGGNLQLDDTPLVLIDDGGWTVSYLTGNLARSAGNGGYFSPVLVLIGDGPQFDSPWFQAFTLKDQPTYGGASGTPASVGGLPGRIEVRQQDTDTKLDGPIVTLTWPLPDGRRASVAASRLTPEEVISMATQLTFAGPTPQLPTQPGFTQAAGASPVMSKYFEYRYDNGNQSLQLDGADRGISGLSSVMTSEVRTTRLVNGVQVAYRPLPGDPGRYWADWVSGDWYYYVDATGFASEAAFLATLGKLKVVQQPAFAEATLALKPVFVGDRGALLTTIEDGVVLPPNAPPIDMSNAAAVTSERDFAFEVFANLTCGWTHAWETANATGDQTAMEAAAAGIETIAVKAATIQDLGDMYSQDLATAMRRGDSVTVANGCSG